ncbi:hypothetical protein J7T55_005968 [Diaporthe amygdali]|uniref:uncharacterized protein n=1 Tax=Phomopsis amygdali TaxID=1214568 RepID=UPI0022FDC5ED|nr:uncharacterized protein J7T55_005968 [Diaporthe amygdali]KAJ0124629.1 hypothetical protein J7T55_005968 [Diaporthe amygdali]
MAGRRVTQLALLLLLSSSCAWANDGTRKPERSDLRLGRDNISVEQAVSLVTVKTELDGTPFGGINEGFQQARHQGRIFEERTPLQPDKDIDDLQQSQARTPTAEEAAHITTPPSLHLPILQRQDNNQGQIDDLNSRLQSAQQSAQQALQSLSDASRRVSQASQQLSQSSQQLSQQSQQLSQQSQQLSASLQQATQSVQSLTQAVSSALSSGSSAFASCTSSASVALAQASGELASKVGEAQAQITLANTQVQQAQGTAVSITQAALAIVGTFIGSSLLTVLIVWLIIRHKRKQKDRAARPMNTGVSSYYGGGPGAEAYGEITKDVKEMMSPASGTTKVGSETARSFGGSRGNDMVTRGYGREKEGGMGTTGMATEPSPGAGGGGDVQIGYARSTNYRERKAPKLSEPPPARRKDSGAGDGTPTPRTPKYEVFPKVAKSPPAAAPPAPGMLGAGGYRPRPRSSIQPDYNLQDWLQTTTVSPFGTLERPNNTTAAAAAATTATTTQPTAAPPPPQQQQQQPKRTSEVKWPLQSSSSSEPPSRSNSNTSRDAEADADADADAGEVATFQPAPAAVGRVPAPPRRVSAASSGPAATRSVRVGVESMRGIGLPGVARKVTLRDSNAESLGGWQR